MLINKTLISFLILCSLLFINLNVIGNTNMDGEEEITNVEKDEALRVSKEFYEKIHRYNDIRPLFDELFINDFEKQITISKNNFALVNLNKDLILQLDRNNIRNYIAVTFNFLNFTMIFYVEKYSLKTQPNLQKVYPKQVIDLISKDPILKELIEIYELNSNKLIEIENIEQFNNLINSLKSINELMKEYLTKYPPEKTATYKKNQLLLNKLKRKYNLYKNPWLSINHNEFGNISEGTRLIHVFVPWGFQIILIKVNESYRVLAVWPIQEE